MSLYVCASSCASSMSASLARTVAARACLEILADKRKRSSTVFPSVSGKCATASRTRLRRERELPATLRPVSYVIAEDSTPSAT